MAEKFIPSICFVLATEIVIISESFCGCDFSPQIYPENRTCKDMWIKLKYQVTILPPTDHREEISENEFENISQTNENE